jgi:hypothetical protein
VRCGAVFFGFVHLHLIVRFSYYMHLHLHLHLNLLRSVLAWFGVVFAVFSIVLVKLAPLVACPHRDRWWRRRYRSVGGVLRVVAHESYTLFLLAHVTSNGHDSGGFEHIGR